MRVVTFSTHTGKQRLSTSFRSAVPTYCGYGSTIKGAYSGNFAVIRRESRAVATVSEAVDERENEQGTNSPIGSRYTKRSTARAMMRSVDMRMTMVETDDD